MPARGLTGVRGGTPLQDSSSAHEIDPLPDDCTPPPLTLPYDPKPAEDK